MYLCGVNNLTEGGWRDTGLPVCEESQHGGIDPTGVEDRYARLTVVLSGR